LFLANSFLFFEIRNSKLDIFGFMERTPKLIIGIIAIVFVVIGLGTYAYLQSREYLLGPILIIEEPLNGSMSTTSRVSVRGLAHNVSFLTLNGRPIFTDELGRFNESLLLQEGYSIMTLEAKDRFGHVVEKRLELVYKPPLNQNENIKMENGTTSAMQS